MAVGTVGGPAGATAAGTVGETAVGTVGATAAGGVEVSSRRNDQLCRCRQWGKERPYRHLLSAAANGDHDPQLLGVISEFEKASHVAKLRGARERKKRATSKCEGRKKRSRAASRCCRAGPEAAPRPDAPGDLSRAGRPRLSRRIRQAVRAVSRGADAARLIANARPSASARKVGLGSSRRALRFRHGNLDRISLADRIGEGDSEHSKGKREQKLADHERRTMIQHKVQHRRVSHLKQPSSTGNSGRR